MYFLSYTADLLVVFCSLFDAVHLIPAAATKPLKDRLQKMGLAKVAALFPNANKSLLSASGIKLCHPSTLKPIFYSTIPAAMAFPFDLFFWGSADEGNIPWFRLTRMLLLPSISRFLDSMERSISVNFALARFLRLLLLITASMHMLACSFFYFTQRDDASHYKTSPWISFDVQSGGNGQLSIYPNGTLAVGDAYVRAAYWALVTMTTVGHVDVIDKSSYRGSGNTWELCCAMVVSLVVSFVYIYVTANFTSMTMRLQLALEQ